MIAVVIDDPQDCWRCHGSGACPCQHRACPSQHGAVSAGPGLWHGSPQPWTGRGGAGREGPRAIQTLYTCFLLTRECAASPRGSRTVSTAWNQHSSNTLAEPAASAARAPKAARARGHPDRQEPASPTHDGHVMDFIVTLLFYSHSNARESSCSRGEGPEAGQRIMSRRRDCISPTGRELCVRMQSSAEGHYGAAMACLPEQCNVSRSAPSAAPFEAGYRRASLGGSETEIPALLSAACAPASQACLRTC